MNLLRVQHFALSTNYVNSFLCYDDATRAAFLVDCGAFEAQISEFISEKQLDLKFLLLTHSHYDHVDGVSAFKKAFPVPIYAPFGSYDHRIQEGDEIPFAGAVITVLKTSGHTPEGVSFYLRPFVFVGDAIFAGAVGGTGDRNHFEEEATHVWQKILTLPEETLICPGHGAPSLVAVERLYNPFFR